MNSITNELLNRMHEAYASDKKAQILTSAAAKTDIADLAYVPANGAKLKGEFSIDLGTMKVTAQQKSGRCWAFAGMNIIREIAAKNCGLKELELSGNYIAFWDKLEKCNNFLEMVIKYADLSMQDRMMEYLAVAVWDGGYFSMFVDLVKKYGIVPASAMPETYTSAHTASFMSQLNHILRRDAAELRSILADKDPADEISCAAAKARAALRKDEMMIELYKALCIVFGEPVSSFDFTWRDQDNQYHADYGLTPMSFYEKYIGLNLDEYVAVTNLPTEDKPLNNTLTFHYVGCMAEGNVLFVNLPMEDLKELSIASLRDGEPIWFACDVSHENDRAMGILDPASFAYGEILGGIDMHMDKGTSLSWHETYGNHAMLLTGVNFGADGQPDRWKIQNSWGNDVGNNGYFVCSDAYFDDFVYQVIIKKKYLNDRQKAIAAQKPIEINPWQG